MKWNPRRSTPTPPPHPGRPALTTGEAAVRDADALAGSHVQPDGAIAQLGGLALTGHRTGVWVREERVLRDLPDHLLPAVIFAAVADGRALRDPRTLTLVPATVQEAQDFAVIGRRVAERSLLPAMAVMEPHLVADALQGVQAVEAELVQDFLGNPDDVIAAPTPAQNLLFGETRRRLPRLLDPDQPAGITPGRRGLDAALARDLFFEGHLAAMLDEAVQEWERLTGRQYARIVPYRMDGAERVLVAAGPICPVLRRLVDEYRDRRKGKVGLLQVTTWYPFPAAELAEWVKGRKALTVLETPGSGEYLINAVREAMDRAIEAEGDSGGYPAYSRLSDRPATAHGLYSLRGGMPDHGDLIAVMENMAGRPERRRYAIGFHPEVDHSRFPQLRLLEQALQDGYPALQDHLMPAADASPAAEGPIQLHVASVNGRHVRQACTLMAEMLADSDHNRVIAHAFQPGDHDLPPVRYRVAFASGDTPDVPLGNAADALMITQPAFLGLARHLKDEAVLLVQTGLRPDVLWQRLPERQRALVRERRLHISVIDGPAIAKALAPIPGLVDSVRMLVLSGAFFKASETLHHIDGATFLERLRTRLPARFGDQRELIDLLIEAFEKGRDSLVPLTWADYPAVPAPQRPENELPPFLRDAMGGGQRVQDMTRFWNTTGFFHEVEQPDLVPAEPAQATGLLPAGTGQLRDLSRFRTTLPQLLPENCTGCGICWTQCPDNALPVTVQDVPALLNTLFSRLRAAGTTLVQMPRLARPIADTVAKLLAGDDLGQLGRLDALLETALDRIAEKADWDDEQRDAVTVEGKALLAAAGDFPVVRTERYFEAPHKAKRGSGRILSLVIDPLACKGCMTCVAVCPEDALEAVEQTDEVVTHHRTHLELFHALPPVAVDDLPGGEDGDDPFVELLDPRVRSVVPGGDIALPGSGFKTVFRLASAAAESVMNRRLTSFGERVGALADEVEKRIQGDVQGLVAVNDFDTFRETLSEAHPDELDAAGVEKLLGKHAVPKTISGQTLQRMLDLHRDLGGIRDRLRAQLGEARLPWQVQVVHPGGRLFWAAGYPFNASAAPHLVSGEAGLAAAATGVFEGIMRQMAVDWGVIRTAEALLERPDSDPFGRVDLPRHWGDLTEEERQVTPPVMVCADVNALSDGELAEVLALLEQRRPLKLVLINGLDDGPPDPGDGFRSHTISPGLWALHRGSAFVLQSSMGLPDHLLSGLREGMDLAEPALFHVYAAEPGMHGLLPDHGPEQGLMAVRSRAFPTFVYRPARGGEAGRLSLDGNPDPETDWSEQTLDMMLSGRREERRRALTVADWAVREGRFRQAFRPVSKRHWVTEMVPLADFLELPAQHRDTHIPFVEMTDRDSRPVRVLVSRPMAAWCERLLQDWRLIQEWGGVRTTGVHPLNQIWQSRLKGALSDQEQQLEAEFTKRLETQAAGQWDVHHQQLTERLMALYRRDADADWLQRTLADLRGNGEEVSE